MHLRIPFRFGTNDASFEWLVIPRVTTDQILFKMISDKTHFIAIPEVTYLRETRNVLRTNL